MRISDWSSDVCSSDLNTRIEDLAKPANSRKTKPRTDAAEDQDFALHSLQEAHEKSPRYAASADEMLTLYEQMLLIRRFEEKAEIGRASCRERVCQYV